MTVRVRLPVAGGHETYQLGEPTRRVRPDAPAASRVAFAATHVVADPYTGTPDWDATLAVRREIWSWRLAVADAMDTAQRGSGLGWAATRELVARSAAEARACGGRLACGVGTDQLDGPASVADVVAAYEEQLGYVTGCGAQPILMCSRQLAGAATGVDDYADVYGRLLGQVTGPVILHWLGPAFDPALTGYWGTEDTGAAVDVVAKIVADHADRVDGVKVSLLEPAHETELRDRLPAGVRCYTGDDLHYQDLIRGDGERGSDALLGVFTAIAPAAAEALQALDRGDTAGYDTALAGTVPLARHLFAAPTAHYKAGVAFVSWLQGNQPGFTMVGGMQTARPAAHLVEAFRLADRAGVLPDPELAAARMRAYLTTTGLDGG